MNRWKRLLCAPYPNLGQRVQTFMELLFIDYRWWDLNLMMAHAKRDYMLKLETLNLLSNCRREQVVRDP